MSKTPVLRAQACPDRRTEEPAVKSERGGAWEGPVAFPRGAEGGAELRPRGARPEPDARLATLAALNSPQAEVFLGEQGLLSRETGMPAAAP